MSKLSEYLNRHVVGNVFDRPAILEDYSCDRSILKITPRLVAFPENTDDIRKLVRFSSQLADREYALPITVRGTGLDKTGASIGEGLIISTEKLNQLEEIDQRGRLVRVQPGITLGRLNDVLRLQGLWLPVDYNPRSTIGGLIANCPSDDISGRYGGIYSYVERLEIVLANGDIAQLLPQTQHSISAKTAESSAEGALYDKINHILDEYDDMILDRSMRPFDAMGYANITKVRGRHTLNLLPLIFASQGTLGIISDVILHVEPLPPESRRLLVSFHDLKTAQRFLNFACDLEPASVKICDLRIIENASTHGKKPDLFTRKIGRGLLVVIDFGNHRFRTNQKIKRCKAVLPPNTFCVEEMPENASAFHCIDTALLSYLNDTDYGERTPVLDDIFIPNLHFGEFVDGLKELEQVLDLELPLFGSFATSNYYVRPELDCASIDGRKKMMEFIRLYSDLVANCQGSLTGNGPEGRVKALMMSRTLGVGERQLYNKIKEAFDPKNILNPKVKMGADVKDTIRCLRTTPYPGVITI